jgi:hypothetical protein
MPITRTPIIDDDGTGRSGTVIDNAWKQELYNQIDALSGASGLWTARAFNAANYSVEAPLTWTPTSAQVYFDRYTYVGNTLLWALKLADITLGGSAAGYVKAIVPGTRMPRHQADYAVAAGYSNGAYAIQKLTAFTAGHIWIRRVDLSPIQPGVFFVDFFVTLEVV